MAKKQDALQLNLFDAPQGKGQLPMVTERLLDTTRFGAQETLALDGDIAPKPIGKTPEQLATLELVSRLLKAETAAILEAAVNISGQQYEGLHQVPNELLSQARITALGPPDIPAQKPIAAAMPASDTQHQPSGRTYKPWSEDRKLRNRGRKLNERINKRFSFPEFLHPTLQEAVLENPEYYGVCPLPTEQFCVVKPDQRLRWQRADEAKAYEALMREQEQR